ncbi:glycosyltransferase family 28 protein [Novymonas esmeraldas]|uniref:UDP-N-acetylglucosamine transferase subunit ALG14 n=1 Tax=Novymonas esmeraldas TaxID=1808958 RepID=A0AAW0F680_9TRYP
MLGCLAVLLLLLLLCVCAFVASLVYNVVRVVPLALQSPHRAPMKVAVVLGSGGHTSEMLRAITETPASHWSDTRPFYVVSATDSHSRNIASQMEKQRHQRRAIVYAIPRAREVGQSYVTSVASTLAATLACFRIVLAERPTVLLTNGPGVCVPVVAAALCVSALAPWWYRRPAVVYLESFTCVSHLSMTGRLLAPWVADVFTVHWRALEEVVAQRRCRGALVYVGCEEARASVRLPLPAVGPEAYALVTVGSTQFAALVDAVTAPEVCAALLRRFGIRRLYVQHGTAPVAAPAGATPLPAAGDTGAAAVVRWSCEGVQVEAFAYRPHLDAVIRGAALVITHAGAGTILEGLQAQRPMVVVPNRQLMSDHQLELAEALAAGAFLFCLGVDELAERLPSLDLAALRPHAGMGSAQLQEALLPVLTGHTVCVSRAKAE